ncbi:PAS domain-containing sensor histidine kinase [Spirosoma pollinicola]|uniref:histidine kinase n=1 Tax=Spirosoma pollinicola TaxID=2057025 RepID=A0A2K8Z6G5_9BACT|nr:ATP-binding protein [Spirosoma pollinicola]AUD05461.1 PAS domain-containing sensor histidine kinase [Spirosoma pollinicola]
MTGEQKPFRQNKELTERLDVDFALKAARLGIWEIDPATNLINWDDQCQELFGLANMNQIPYEQAIRYIHPDDLGRVDKAVKQAMDLQSNGKYDVTYRTIGAATGQLRWVRFIGKSYLNESGEVYRFSGVALDVSDDVQARQQIELSEHRFRNLIKEAPFAIGVYTSRELIIEMANDAMIKVWGKTPSVIGMKLADALPELEGQPFIGLLEQVYDTNIPYQTAEQLVNLVVDGRLQTYWFTFTYQPLTNEQGKVYAILNMAVDVTERVLATQKLVETQTSMRGAIELAELATWHLDIKKNTFSYSKRFMGWLGFSDESKTLDEAYNPLPPSYRQSVANAIEAVTQPGSSGIYENEHPIINRLTGQTRIIHAQAQVFYDAAGKPALLSGTAHDVTEQRRINLALEQQVQERTEELEITNEELAATIEELAATNEELAATNEELTEANDVLAEFNQHLTRSNQNLEQFAYIASHDLQEPLRKIQQFSDLLKTHYATSSGEELVYLERMQLAASRMSLLIKDLLAFSRISTSPVPPARVSLTRIVDEALENLSVAIDETNAQIEVGTLPTLQGDALQLGQLFQNLFSNALKFRRQGVLPKIRVSARSVLAVDLPITVKPARQAVAFHSIEVEDNGIGFEEKYADRIFQVFQRLHGKNEFAGTGVGLAICQKVVTNHGGAITAMSQPGQGARFCIYLPV